MASWKRAQKYVGTPPTPVCLTEMQLNEQAPCLLVESVVKVVFDVGAGLGPPLVLHRVELKLVHVGAVELEHAAIEGKQMMSVRVIV